MLAPPLTDEECAEILRSFGGAKLSEAPKTVAALNAIARGHSTLVAALANSLRERSWKMDDETLSALLSGEYAAGTHAETLSALFRLTADARTRELLYRMKLAGSSIELTDARALGRVPPAIDGIDARVHAVRGVWLQPVGKDRLELSPMLAVLPQDQLDTRLRRACHRALADELRRRQPLNQHTAISLVTHYLQAEDFDVAGISFGLVLTRLIDSQGFPPPGLILDMWWNTPLPSGMSRGMQLFVRDTQARAGARYGRDTTHIELDIDRLASDINGIDGWGLVGVVVRRFRERFKPVPDEAATWMYRGLKALSDPELRRVYSDKAPDIVPLVWTIVTDVGSRSHIRVWLSLLEHLLPSDRIWEGAAGERVRRACHLVTNNCWTNESTKPVEERRFAERYEDLLEIARRARVMDFTYLEACATRGLVTILCEFAGKFEEGASLANEFLARPVDQHCSTLVRDAVGRQLFHADRFEEALDVLGPVIDGGTALEPLVCELAANYASRAAAMTTPAKPALALSFAQRAVAIADGMTEEASEAARVRTRGELAIALVLANHPERACEVLLQAGDVIAQHRHDRKWWRELIIGILQVAMVTLASSRSSLPGNRRRFVETPLLRRGYFFSGEDLDKFWRPDSPALLAFQMWDASTSIQNKEVADRWLNRFLDAKVSGDTSLITPMTILVLPHLVESARDDALIRAIDLAKQFGASVKPDWTDVDFGSPEGPLGPALLVPVVLWLAEVSILEPAYAASAATVLAQRLRTLADVERSPGGWERAAQLLERAFVARATYSELFAWAATEEGMLRECAYLLASTAADALPHAAASIQSQLIARLWTGGVVALETIATRWLVSYWTTAFHRSRFLFGSPRLLENALGAAVSLPMRARARRVLGAVVASLGVAQHESFSRWLSGLD